MAQDKQRFRLGICQSILGNMIDAPTQWRNLLSLLGQVSVLFANSIALMIAVSHSRTYTAHQDPQSVVINTMSPNSQAIRCLVSHVCVF